MITSMIILNSSELKERTMLVDLDAKTYRHYFPNNPHPFLREDFLDLNEWKCSRILRLAEDKPKKELGLVAGVKNEVIMSHFSAPFGGFHFRNELVYTSEIDAFLSSLKEYIISSELKGIEIILPPDLYHPTFNAKTINSFIRGGFTSFLPEITGWIDLRLFSGEFVQKNSREYYRQAIRNGLSFIAIDDLEDRQSAFNLIRLNREKFNRPIFMTFKDIMDTGNLWPVDFFKVIDRDGNMVASAIFYRSSTEICHAAFWGDNDLGRPLRAIDFLAHNLWSFYKGSGFRYIDVGISTEAGYPNEGLIRFKESHDAISSLRYRFSWHKSN